MISREGIGPGGSPYKIVICDDKQTEANQLRQFLESRAFKVIQVFGDGKALLDWCSNNPGQADLVLLDIIMPTMDGFAAFFELKKIRPMPRVVFLSVENSSQVIGHLIQSGAYDFIAKPFDKINLLNRIKVVLKRSPPL